MVSTDTPLRIAIVRPWFLANGGAEQTVNALAEIYPTAEIFTLFYREQDLPVNLRGRKITAHKWNWLPGKFSYYRQLLPLYPLLFESFDLRGFGLVISSDSCVAKGILIDQNAIHVCYCHSPMRCLWDLTREFSETLPSFVRPIFTLGTHYVRQWDMLAAQRVDAFIANSSYIAQRIRKYYRRESTVIHPPVGTQKGYLSATTEDYYLSVGRLSNLKKVDLLIHTCNYLGRRLVIAGAGRELKNLKSIAGPTVEFAGYISERKLADLYARCRAFLFAPEEDFGIVPVEAQSYGRPVVACGRGGARETIIPLGDHSGRSPTGVFFYEHTVDSVAKAILEFEAAEAGFDPKLIQRHAREFDSQVFARKLQRFVSEATEQERAAHETTASLMALERKVREFSGEALENEQTIDTSLEKKVS